MAELLLYGIIGEPADALDARTVTAAIRGSTGPLAVRINSPGGFVMEGLAIIEALRSYPGKVTIYIDGLAASMASAIAMVGAETIMAESALLMVHKPWDSSIGNATDLRADAAKLDRIEAQLVGIYAKRTGLPEGDLATMLAAETWLTPEEALAAGFVTSISASLKLAAMADVSAYGFRHTPAQLKGTDMTDTATAVAAERTRISTIISLCDKHKLGTAFATNLIDKTTTVENAREAILDALATRDERTSIGHAFSGSATLDNPATYGAAIRDALVAKISGKPATGAATEFQAMSVVDIARDFLARGGERDVHRMQPDRVISMATRPGGARGQTFGMGGVNIGGLHTVSDFPDLIGSAAEKYLIERYKLQESPLKLLARKTTRSNFLMQYGVQMGGFGALDRVAEGGEFKNKSVETRKEGYKIDTYGNMFAVSRQMLINDALGALSDVLTIMARAATETEALLLAALINSGSSTVLMSDGKPWFDPAHGNLAAVGGSPSITTLDAGRVAMRSQKDLDNTGIIDANPKFMLVPVNLQTTASALTLNTLNTSVTSGTDTTFLSPNVFSGEVTPISDPRIINPNGWYLFADPAFSPALQYSYLDGHESPFLDSQDGWRVDGTEYKVRHDFGAGVLDWRFAYKNPGAPA